MFQGVQDDTKRLVTHDHSRRGCLLITCPKILYTTPREQDRNYCFFYIDLRKCISVSPKQALKLQWIWELWTKEWCPQVFIAKKSGSGARLLPFFLAHLWLAGAVAAHLGRERQCWELSQAPQWNMQAEGIVIEHLSCCGLSVWYSMERCWCWGAKRCKIDWSAVWGQFVYVVFQYSWLSKVSSETSC